MNEIFVHAMCNVSYYEIQAEKPAKLGKIPNGHLPGFENLPHILCYDLAIDYRTNKCIVIY